MRLLGWLIRYLREWRVAFCLLRHHQSFVTEDGLMRCGICTNFWRVPEWAREE